MEELQSIASAFPSVPLVANIVEGGKTPQLSASELHQMGFKIVFFPLSALLSVTKVMSACFHQLKEQGTTTDFQDMVSFKDFQEMIGIPKYHQLEQQFLGK